MACDSCRRRKVKCNDARPQCEDCAKRSLKCTYEGEPGPPKRPRLSDRGVSVDGGASNYNHRAGLGSPNRPKNQDAGRLDRLESLVKELARQIPASSAATDGSHSLNGTPARQHAATLSPGAMFSSSDHDVSRPAHKGSLSTDDARARLVDIYTQSIHCQPLPLFDPQRFSENARSGKLSADLETGLGYLDYTSPIEAFAVQQLRRSAYESLAEGDVSLDLAQLFCVLILVSMKCEEWTQAQIALGTVSRMIDEILAVLPTKRIQPHSRSMDIIRCAQSVFILECILRRSSPDMPRLDRVNHLIGLKPHAKTLGPFRGPNAEHTPLDLGVQQYCLQLFLIWRRTISYLDLFRTASTAKPWQPESEYQTIIQELYVFETSLAQEHRVGNLRLEERTNDELEEHRSYWAPWFTMQFLFHAIQALANHPLIHITKLGGDLGFRPPSFSQQTADQARLHAGWVTRLVRACQEKNFVIHDPFIGHLVAAVSTVQLFWMDDRSDQIAHEAIDCHRTCEAFLGSMAENWPHLRNTLHRLRLLAQSAAPAAPALAPSSANGRPLQGQPKHSAQLELLLPMFQYHNSSLPVPEKTALADSVPLPRSLEFLTPLDQKTSSPGQGGNGNTAAVQGVVGDGTAGLNLPPFDALHDVGVNIFDTSDILNTTLLDGTLWPGQL